VTALLKLCRLYYVVPFSLGFTLIYYYALGGRLEGHRAEAALGAVALRLVLGGAYVLHDVVGIEVDRVNAPHRPLARGELTRRAGSLWGGVLMAAGLAVAAGAQLRFLPVLAAVALGLVLYDRFSKRIGVGKQLTVAALMVSLYPMAYAQAGGFSGPRAASLYAFPVWLFFSTFAYELLKDLLDVRGDRLVAKRPSVLELRPESWRWVARLSVLAGMPFAIAPLWMGCGTVYLAIAAIGLAAGIASLFLSAERAIAAVYAEVFLVASAAAADVAVS